jgi:pyridoxamine 5'-phosphate oxidase family protein
LKDDSLLNDNTKKQLIKLQVKYYLLSRHLIVMSIFSDKEVEYILSHSVARIATVAEMDLSPIYESENGFSKIIQPDVVPVGFHFDAGYFYIGGIDMLRSTKYKNIIKNSAIALIIDDFKSIKPLQSRGIKVYGEAEITKRQGAILKKNGLFETVYLIIISPKKKWSWGIDHC